MNIWNMRVPKHRLRAGAALGLSAALAFAAGCAPATPPAKAPVTRSFGAAIENGVPYQPAVGGTKCVASSAKPGPIRFRDLLLATYGSKVGGLTVWTGITRPCDGTVSEHAEGRALDWGMDYRNVTMQADGKAVLAWLLATDKYGNRDAIATRLGIMYVIWNKQIYGSWNHYQAAPYKCGTGTDPTACHVNHMHFSFDWPGARAQTSFFTGRVG
jgi:hypothetical protein